MSRAGATRTACDGPLADRLGVALLTSAFPADLVDGVLREADRVERRSRALPARAVVYFSLAMWLYAPAGYPEVMQRLVTGLARKHRWAQPWRVPSTAAIAKARQRLGPKPLQLLFEQVAGPVATRDAPGAFYRDWRLMAQDSTHLDVQDTALNRDEYGAPPRVRLTAVAEVGNHAVCAAALGPGLLGSADPGQDMPGIPRAGQLLIVERFPLSGESWQRARVAGGELLAGVDRSTAMNVRSVLDDGSAIARPAHWSGGEVRVVDFSVADGPSPHSQVSRLVTSVLNPAQAPAADLARLLVHRWSLKATLCELNAQPSPDGVPVLRSKSPAMVEQELWAMLLAHHAVRHLVVPPSHERLPDHAEFTRRLRLLPHGPALLKLPLADDSAPLS